MHNATILAFCINLLRLWCLYNISVSIMYAMPPVTWNSSACLNKDYVGPLIFIWLVTLDTRWKGLVKLSFWKAAFFLLCTIPIFFTSHLFRLQFLHVLPCPLWLPSLSSCLSYFPSCSQNNVVMRGNNAAKISSWTSWHRGSFNIGLPLQHSKHLGLCCLKW